MTCLPRNRIRANAYAASEQSSRFDRTTTVVTTVVFQNHRANGAARRVSV